MTQQQSTEPVLTGVRNFRDVGGLPTGDGRRVRPGRLYRSGHLAHATAEDRAVLESLGLHTVYDFRSGGDLALEGPDIELPGVRNRNIPLNDTTDASDFWRVVTSGTLAELRGVLGDGQAVARMTDSYRIMVGTRRAEHGRVLCDLAEGSTPALLHCSAGKDRAGLMVALTLLAVGVERDAVVEDYLLSSAPANRYRITRDDGAEGGLSEEVLELLAPMFDARAAYIRAAFEEIQRLWGGTERYFTEGLGLSAEHREQLREVILEG